MQFSNCIMQSFTHNLIKSGLLPENMMNDSIHISNYIFSDCSYLISFNYKHIANAKIKMELKKLL